MHNLELVFHVFPQHNRPAPASPLHLLCTVPMHPQCEVKYDSQPSARLFGKILPPSALKVHQITTSIGFALFNFDGMCLSNESLSSFQSTSLCLLNDRIYKLTCASYAPILINVGVIEIFLLFTTKLYISDECSFILIYSNQLPINARSLNTYGSP